MKIRIRGFEIAYEDTGGAATPLLFIHGFPLDRTLWAAQTRGLADIARIIAPDLRGFGESGMPADAVTVDTYADDLRGLLDALGVKNAVIGGLSMGGYIAFAFYRKYAHRMRALILVDTRPGADSPEAKEGRDDNAALAREKGAAAIADRMLPKMLAPKTFASYPDVANVVRVLMERQSVEGIVGALMAMRDRPDSTPTLTEISTPTLIVVGAEDTLTPPKEAEAMCKVIRGARLVTIPDAAHLSNVEQPEVFNHAVREFLKSFT
jgi:pimeloyl-ACP methyl ester carboxylesterase